ncbi:MAG: PTS lactose/cellobiose transporter subunit IIA [Chloroflexi bacterium]|nr:PTS lactose/cellobiose transporter subunit IIA [Chloroflexota bacterium]
MNQEEAALQLILHGGDARALSYDALKAAKSGDFREAEIKLKKAGEALAGAHAAQKSLLEKEARGEALTPTFLLVHAHGHVMTASAELSLIEQMIDLYKRLPPEGPA